MGLYAKLIKFRDDSKGLMDIVYIAVYLGIAVVAGAIILYISQAVTNITVAGGLVYNTTAGATNSHLANASNNLYNTADIGYSFLPIVAVAAIGSIAIGYVFGLIPGMKGKGGGGGGI